MPCPYAILGIPYGTTNESDIRTAYKKKALLYHPDKNRDAPDEASAKFTEVQEAYSKLMQGVPTDLDVDLEEVLKYLYAVMVTAIKPAKDICVGLSVPFSDVYHSRVKKLTLQVKRWTEEKVYDLKGSETVFVPLGQWTPDQSEYVFEHKGDDAICRKLFRRSDVSVCVRVDDLHPHVSVIGRHLVVTIDMTVHDFYDQKELRVSLAPSVEDICFPNTQQFEYELKGRGLRDGDLQVNIKLRVPRVLPNDSPETRQCIRNLFKEF